MADFLTLKMLPLALALIKPKKCHHFAPLVKNHPFYMGNCSKTKFAFKIELDKKLSSMTRQSGDCCVYNYHYSIT